MHSVDREAAVAFSKFDTDGNGTIDVEELGQLMEKLGLKMESAEV